MGCKHRQHLCKAAALLLLAASIGCAAGLAAGLLRRQRRAGIVREAGLIHKLAHALASGAALRCFGIHGLHHRGWHLCALGARLQPVEILRSKTYLSCIVACSTTPQMPTAIRELLWQPQRSQPARLGAKEDSELERKLIITG